MLFSCLVLTFLGQAAVFSSVGGAEELSEEAPPSVATGPGGMDEVDHHGNTPLLLALQLGRLECANVSSWVDRSIIRPANQMRAFLIG